jgi:hypothetical protein
MAQHRPVRWLLLTGAVLAVAAVAGVGARRFGAAPATIQFVFTSDAHYGLTRPAFRGGTHVDAAVVNGALVASVNSLRDIRFPMDGGLRAGEPVGGLDFLVEGGDIANREEATGPTPIQPASESWSQFVHDYVDGLHTLDGAGRPTRLFVVPGNHDASNAVGFYKPMRPTTDLSSFVSIYNLMLAPPHPLTAVDFDYARDRLFFSRDVAGIHFQFLQIWPDSVMRTKMAEDLSAVDSNSPVVVFTHDQPDVEAKHFINPNGGHAISAEDQFENLLADQLADGPTIDLPSTVEQAQLESFLSEHRNITAYFHGNSNWHQAYEWNGPRRSARLHAFRVDSPMKGAISAADETRLSFHVVTIDVSRRAMTVRECLWNAQGADTRTVTWGDAVTVTLEPLSRAPRQS